MLYLGIDVSKDKLDCALLDPLIGTCKIKVVANSAKGCTALVNWLDKLKAIDVHAIMEPTGFYHEASALKLMHRGLLVTLVNPRRLRRYAEAIGVQSKSDTADSCVLARYGAHEKPPQWQPPSVAVRQLRTLLSRHTAIAKDLQREKNRAERTVLTDTPELVLQSMQTVREVLEQQQEQLDAAIKRHILDSSELTAKWHLLLTIPGVGPRLASYMIAVLVTRNFEHAEQFAAYLGLTPVKWESGTSVHKRPRLPQAAPKRLRSLFFFPAIAALRSNPDVAALNERLLKRGAPKMVAVGAAMHKLAHQCFGVLKSGEPYDPDWRQATSKAKYARGTVTPLLLCPMSDE